MAIPARIKRLLTKRPDVESVSDPNFIGFDKYRDHGAYHWKELQKNQEYR